MKASRFTLLASAIAAASLAFSAQARASVPFTQGFETDTSSWLFGTDNSGTAAINRVASGGGALHLTAQSGGFYAELTNGQDGYDPTLPGYGDAGYSNLGGHAVGAYPGSSFAQSLGVYLDTSWAPAAAAGVPAFWIDMTASSQTTGTYDFGTEHNFRIMSPAGGSIGIAADGGTPFATALASGWYTFEMVYSQGASGTDPSLTTLNVYDPTDTLIGSTTITNSSLSSDLGGSGYEWMTVWQNGFAGNTLGIDNVQTEVVPEPASIGLLACGAVGLLARRRKMK